MRLRRGATLAATLALLAATGGVPAASVAPLCTTERALTAREQDRLLRVADVLMRELDASSDDVALIARSGLDLSRFGLRYSHAGVSLRRSLNGPWSVRQLYYACGEGRPRLFDQGLAGFLSGTDDAARGHVSVLLLPRASADALERTALDGRSALALLGGRYSANAHPFSTRYQNCNQWVMELLALAWGDLDAGEGARARAQHWLAAQGYAPAPVQVGSHALMFAAGFMPWITFDDHPREDIHALRFHLSLPATIDEFVRRRLAGVRRLQLCHADDRIVLREGWAPIADGCEPGAGDRVLPL